MASWIVHLRLAELLLQMIDGLDAHYFAIGNIAPDSGIPDENWEKFDLAQLYAILREGTDTTPFSTSLDLPQFAKDVT